MKNLEIKQNDQNNYDWTFQTNDERIWDGSVIYHPKDRIEFKWNTEEMIPVNFEEIENKILCQIHEMDKGILFSYGIHRVYLTNDQVKNVYASLHQALELLVGATYPEVANDHEIPVRDRESTLNEFRKIFRESGFDPNLIKSILPETETT